MQHDILQRPVNAFKRSFKSTESDEKKNVYGAFKNRNGRDYSFALDFSVLNDRGNIVLQENISVADIRD